MVCWGAPTGGGTGTMYTVVGAELTTKRGSVWAADCLERVMGMFNRKCCCHAMEFGLVVEINKSTVMYNGAPFSDAMLRVALFGRGYK